MSFAIDEPYPHLVRFPVTSLFRSTHLRISNGRLPSFSQFFKLHRVLSQIELGTDKDDRGSWCYFFFEPEINDNIFLDVSIATYNGVGFQDTTNNQARQRSPSSHINQSL